MPQQTYLMTVVGRDRAPTLQEAARQLGVRTDDLVASFGVVAIDPAKGLYAVEVLADAAESLPHDPDRGPFSNPQIEPLD